MTALALVMGFYDVSLTGQEGSENLYFTARRQPLLNQGMLDKCVADRRCVEGFPPSL
jgi:hypothetical protein